MTCSTFVWIKSDTVAVCQNLGFSVEKGRGENRSFIRSSDNPFNPSADIHRIPGQAVVGVTIRATIKSAIPLGLYAVDEFAEMRVSAHYENHNAQQGFFTIERKVVSVHTQTIDLRAQKLADALCVFINAQNGQLKPDPVRTAEITEKFD